MRLRIPVTELAVKRGKTAVIVGAQWGDEGKGKIVDVLSENFSVVARYAGGHNAGHTVIINGKKFILQLVPCGVLRAGCRSVIGNGVVLDPLAFLKEAGALREAGVKLDGHLFVSNRAHVILPYHRMIELAAENAPGRVKIGTLRAGLVRPMRTRWADAVCASPTCWTFNCSRSISRMRCARRI